MTSPWAQSPEAGVESPGPHPAPDSPGTGWGTWWRDWGRNGRRRGGVWGVSPPHSPPHHPNTDNTTSPPLGWLWTSPCRGNVATTPDFMTSPIKSQDFSLPHRERGRQGTLIPHAHINTRIHRDTQATTTHTASLFLFSLRNGGGKPYQVISGKIDDDSIIVQILSHAAPSWTSIQNTLLLTPRGSPSMLRSTTGVCSGHEKVA